MQDLTIQEVSLKDILANIKKNKYVIPNFQRGYVWENSDRLKLGDSLLWCYPVSSLLMLPTSFEVEIGSTPLEVTRGIQEGTPEFYVLDGQQRLTSIGRIFMPDTGEKEVFYFDLLSIIGIAEMAGNLQSISSLLTEDAYAGQLSKLIEILKKIDPSKNPIILEDLCCKQFKTKTKESAPDHKDDYRYLRCDLTLDSKYSVPILKFIERYFKNPMLNNGYKEDLTDIITEELVNYLNSLFGNLANYKIPITTISGDSSLDLICNIFERLNSSGEKLTTFDLVNAKTYDETTKGIGNRIKSEMDSSDLFNCFFSTIEQGGYLRIAHIADKLTQKQRLDLTNGLLLNRPKDFWFNFIDSNKSELIEAITYLRENGFLAFGNKAFLEYATAVILANKQSLNQVEFKNFLKKYALHIGTHGASFTKTNLPVVGQMDKYIKQLTVIPNPLDRLKVAWPEYVPFTKLEKSDFLKIKPRSNSAKISAILHILNVELGSSLDILGQDHNLKASYVNSSLKMQKHHIIPKKSGALKDRPELDSLANIALVAGELNLAISNLRFEVYVGNLLNEADFNRKNDIKRGLTTNLIPEFIINKIEQGISFSDSDYLEMLDYRANEMVKKINNYFGID